MKRISALMLALILCISFIGCAKSEDKSEVYLAAKEKTDSLTSFDATMELSMIFDTDGAKSGTESVVKTKLDRSNADSPVYYTEYAVTDIELDYEYISSTYFADETVYEKSAMDEKYKMKVAVESIENRFSSIAMDFPSDVFKKASVKGEAVTAKAAAADLADMMSSFTTGIESRFAPVETGGSFEFEYSDVTLGFKTNSDGYFTEMTVECEISFDHADGSTKADISQKIIFNSPGSAVTITAPDDLDSYPWYEEDSMTQEEMEEQFMNDILALFEFADGSATRVSNFDELYAQCCAKYGKEAVDSYIETIEMLGMIGSME